jgi:hypothetical protein
MDLYDQGYNNQVCVDFSKVVIQDMASRFSEKEGIDWKVADVRDMRDFSDGEFDAAIDKSTLDTMMHGSIWDPPEDVRRSTGSYIDEVSNPRANEVETSSRTHMEISGRPSSETWWVLYLYYV